MSLHSEFFGLLLSERDLRARRHDDDRRGGLLSAIKAWAAGMKLRKRVR